jgi:VanZ family protein
VVSSVPDVPDLLPGASSDKLAHGIVYSGLGFLLARALTAARPERLGLRLTATVVLLAVLYGLSDEVHQLFVPGRAFELRDLLADLIGSALGAGAYRLCDIIGRPARGSGLA